MKESEWPHDEIIIQDGKVAMLSEWGEWNGRPYLCVRITRRRNGSFCVYVSNPRHGGEKRTGRNLKELSSFMRGLSLPRYKKLFALDGVTAQHQFVDLLKRPLTTTVVF